MKDSTGIAGICAGCQKEIQIASKGPPCGPGYATLPNGGLLCYSCCAAKDREWMTEHGHIVLYLTGGEVRNWPGTLGFPVQRSRRGRHNITQTRTDVWFRDPEGNNWWGVNYGNSMLVHCKRIKS